MAKYRFKKKQLDEFINKDGTLINKNVPDNINPKTSSKSTTDQFIRATTQQRGLHGFFRAYGEAELPYNDIADQYQESPEEFFMFLQTKGEEEQFGQYFQKREDDESSESEIINPADVDQDIEVVQTTTNQPNPETEVTTEPEEKIDRPSIRKPKSAVYEGIMKEFKSSDKIISGKLDRILEYVNNSCSENQREAILEYCKNVVNGK